jgi:hypothetical protein
MSHRLCNSANTRADWLVPVPEAIASGTLNEQIPDGCVENRSRTIIGRCVTIGQASELEREHLSPLSEEGIDQRFSTRLPWTCFKTVQYSDLTFAGTLKAVYFAEFRQFSAMGTGHLPFFQVRFAVRIFAFT